MTALIVTDTSVAARDAMNGINADLLYSGVFLVWLLPNAPETDILAAQEHEHTRGSMLIQ